MTAGRYGGRVASSYAVYTSSRADRDLEKLPAADRQRILEAILALGDDPYPAGSTKLRGRDGRRIRVGDYRALYLVDEGQQEVTVLRVAHRREVYR